MFLLPFTKMQSVGNDFVVVEAARWPDNSDWTREAVRLCDRHFGAGADGLLVLAPSDTADFRMRMFNPDGTEDMCGNGLRCIVAFAVERNGAKREGVAQTIAGNVVYEHFDAAPDALSPSPTRILTTLPAPDFAPALLPMRGFGADELERVIGFPLTLSSGDAVTVSVVSTGTTHTVIWGDELPSDETFFALSPQIENHPAFPDRTSVLWARLDGASEQGFEQISVRIWERGAGETWGCGTGAAALAVLGSVEDRLSSGYALVKSKGGRLLAGYAPETPAVVLTGAAHFVYDGEVAPTADNAG